MTTQQDPQSVSSIDQILADAKIIRRKMKTKLKESEETGEEISSKYLLTQITENIIPLIVASVEEIAEVDEVVQEVIDHEESYLQKEDAMQFLITFRLGDAAVELLREFVTNLDDDLARKRHTELVDGFEKSLEVSKLALAAIISDSLDDDDDDDDDDDSDQNEEDKDDSDSDDGIERLDGDGDSPTEG